MIVLRNVQGVKGGIFDRMLAGASRNKGNIAIPFICTRTVRLNITCPWQVYDYGK